MLDFGADPNATDDAEETPAMVAARVNDAVSLRALLRAGADLDRTDENGMDGGGEGGGEGGTRRRRPRHLGWIAARGRREASGFVGEEYDPDELD